VKRLDLHEVIVGKGGYIDDFPFRGKYAVFVRSSYPHARIKRVDATDARNKGALVLTGKEILARSVESGEREGASLKYPLLAADKALYVGQPVALVLGNDPYEAADLAELVQVDYEPLEPVPNIERGLEEKSILFEDLGTNVVRSRSFEFGKLPKEGKRIELSLYYSRSAGNPIETYGAIVTPIDDGLMVISNMQGANTISRELQNALGVKVVHRNARQGGSFGTKASLVRYLTVLGFAALKFGVPLKWIETRTEHLMASNASGPERKFRIEVLYSSSGEVLGLDMNVWEDVGASKESGQPFKAMGILSGPYKVRNIRYTVNLVATNKNPAGAFRGAGTPPHTWALERVMDAVADELGMDRAEVRRRNLIDTFPYETDFAVYDSGNPKMLLDLALSRRDVFSMRDNRTGVGLAVSTDPSTPSGREEVKISIRGGKVVVGLGFGPEGQGNEHIAVLLTSRLLGINPERVTYEVMDNLKMGNSFGPGGSRMAAYTAGAISGAVEELKARLRRRAEAVLGSEDLEYREGHFVSPKGRIEITQFEGEEVNFTFSLQGKRNFVAYPFACDLAVVRVEDGRIRPVRHVVYIDPGTPLDEDLIREQIIGGTATGISIALLERFVYDSNGNLLTTSLGDYGMPTAADLPQIEVNIVPTPSPLTPMGVKGIGEVPVGVAAAAVVRAVEDVVKRRISRVPIDLEEILG